MPISAVKGVKKNGLQKYRVRVHKGNTQIERTAYGMDNAKVIEAQLLSAPKNASRKTLKQLFNEYMSSKKSEVKENTYYKNIERAANFLNFLGNRYIDKLSAADIQKWKNDLNERVSEKTHKSFSLRTKREVRCLLRDVLNYAVRLEYINRNPVDSVPNFKESTHAKKETSFYTVEEFNAFIETARLNANKVLLRDHSINEYNYYTFFMIAFWMGARKGEINALTWKDIDGDVMHITKSINQKLKSDNKITPPKNSASIRDVQMPQRLIAALGEQKERQMKIPGFSEDWFVTGGKTYLRDTSIDLKNRAYSEEASLHKIRIHDFRHSNIALLIHLGVEVKEVSERVGHSKTETTWNVYTHIYPQAKNKAIQVLESA